LPTIATGVHNAASFLNGVLEIAISSDREASAAKEIAGDRFSSEAIWHGLFFPIDFGSP
jgi:hypothetical protein